MTADTPPPRGAHRLGQPRLADWPGIEQRPAVARALHGDRRFDGGPVAKIVERERERTRDGLADLELEGRLVDERHVVVDQEVVQPDGVIGQRSASSGMAWFRAASRSSSRLIPVSAETPSITL